MFVFSTCNNWNAEKLHAVKFPFKIGKACLPAVPYFVLFSINGETVCTYFIIPNALGLTVSNWIPTREEIRCWQRESFIVCPDMRKRSPSKRRKLQHLRWNGVRYWLSLCYKGLQLRWLLHSFYSYTMRGTHDPSFGKKKYLE